MAYQVGGNQGMAYTGQEGKGKAFILPEDDDSMLAYQNLLKGVKDNKLAKATAKDKQEAKKKATKKKLKEEVPEWWIAHDTELQGLTDNVMNLGADLMAAGISDPMSGTDPGSVEFKKQLERLKSLGNLSTQYKTMYEADRKIINNDKENYYTEESKDKLVNEFYYGKETLSDRLDNGDLPPRLIVKEPEFELMKHYQGMAKELGAKNPDPEDADYEEQVLISLNDPSTTKFKESLLSNIENIKKDPDAWKRLEDEAAANMPGVAPEVYLGTKQLRSFFGDVPINISEIVTANLPQTDEKKYKGEDLKGNTTWNYETFLDPDKLTTAAKSAIEMNPALLKDWAKKGIAANKDEAIDYMEELMKAQIKTKKDSGISREGEDYNGTGRGEKEVLTDRDLWYKAIAGGLGDTPEERYRNRKKAMEYISGTKDPEGKVFISGRSPKGSMPQLLGTAPGTEEDYNPNMLVFEMTDPQEETEEYYDPVSKSKKKRKRTIHNKMEQTYQFKTKGDGNYFSKDKGHGFYIQGVKNKKSLFSDMLGEEGEAYTEERTYDENVQKGIKSKARENRASGTTEEKGEFDDDAF